MAVAAYAAIASLIDVLNRIQHPAMHRLHLDRKQIEALQDKLSFLQEFLELYHSQRISNEIQSLAWQISNVANEAEDIVDSHVVNQIRKGFPDHSGALTLFCENIERVIEKIDSIKGELMMFKEVMEVEKQLPEVSLPAVSTGPPSMASGRNSMVGFDKHLVRIMDELTGYRSNLRILPIVGMGGIGKTTLARNVFDNSLIVYHFHVRLWVTISQGYSVREILLGLLHEDGEKKKERSDYDLADLGEELYKSLSGRRYLVVMDDVWSSKVWDDLRIFFPDNKNGSRIMVTTRLSDVTASFGSNNPFLMDFLDEDQSWNLFCEKVFMKKGCPPELEKIGKNIAKSCKGLPLAIVVIGGLLSNSNMTRHYWESVAENVNSFANSANDEHCLKILSLSYNNLPIHLKPCFLYMRVFPEDDQIEVSKIIKLWVAEGFLKPTRGKTLEEVAEEYLKDLIDRNLILIRTWMLSGKIKACSIHDLLRDLCFRESQKEHFRSVLKVQQMHFLGDSENCFLCGSLNRSTKIYVPQIHGISQPTSLVHCSVCDACRVMHPRLDRSRLVRAMNSSIEGFLLPTKLRYHESYPVHVRGFELVPTLLPLLWNLQTLIILGSFLNVIILPSEIWGMPKLRHLISSAAVLSDPPDTKGSTTILENLQTLSFIKEFRCSGEILARIPNHKKLGIRYYDNDIKAMEWSYYSLHNLVHLCRLESLVLRCSHFISREISFPHSLKKLKLFGCKIAWEEMTIVGSLPNLEVLKLLHVTFEQSKWNPVEGEFLRLKLLLIKDTDLKYWTAERIHFPSLESLVLEFMLSLVNIPSEIGDIETLRLIRLIECNESTVNSAREILEEQHNLGNEILELDVRPSSQGWQSKSLTGM